jgi:phospholipase/carboxylesterase
MLVKKGKPDGLGIMFLHGYGANGADLFSLADELSWSDQETWYFPDAPIEVPLGPQYMGRAWFPIPLRELQTGVDYSNATPPGLEKAVQHVRSLIRSLPHQKWILGGFSQGAMLATHLVLTEPDLFAGLAILSGTLVHSAIWKKAALSAKKKLAFFQSHGALDPVLPIEGAVKLNDLLNECEWHGQLLMFKGGHEIPSGVIRDLKSYLRHQTSLANSAQGHS